MNGFWIDLKAENLISGDTIDCAYADFPGHAGFFLALMGEHMSTRK